MGKFGSTPWVVAGIVLAATAFIWLAVEMMSSPSETKGKPTPKSFRNESSYRRERNRAKLSVSPPASQPTPNPATAGTATGGL